MRHLTERLTKVDILLTARDSHTKFGIGVYPKRSCNLAVFDVIYRKLTPIKAQSPQMTPFLKESKNDIYKSSLFICILQREKSSIN